MALLFFQKTIFTPLYGLNSILKKWMNYIVMNCIKDGSIMSYSSPTGKN